MWGYKTRRLEGNCTESQSYLLMVLFVQALWKQQMMATAVAQSGNQMQMWWDARVVMKRVSTPGFLLGSAAYLALPLWTGHWSFLVHVFSSIRWQGRGRDMISKALSVLTFYDSLESKKSMHYFVLYIISFHRSFSLPSSQTFPEAHPISPSPSNFFRISKIFPSLKISVTMMCSLHSPPWPCWCLEGI